MSARHLPHLQCKVSSVASKLETVNVHDNNANPHFILELRNNYVTTKDVTFPS